MLGAAARHAMGGFEQNFDGEGNSDPSKPPSYDENAAFEGEQSINGIKVSAIAANSKKELQNAKALISDLANTDLGKNIAAAQARGEAKFPNVLINSGATSSSGGLNFASANSDFLYIDTRTIITTTSVTGGTFAVPWQRLLTHEFVHVGFPEMSGPDVIRKTNSAKHIWNGKYNREPYCHDLGC